MSLVLRIIFVILNFCIVVGCTSEKNQTTGRSALEGAGDKVVNLAIWSNYISQSFLDQFEKETGIKVNVSNYSSNEELLGKLQAGGTAYDIAIPSDYMVGILAKLGLLVPLDANQLKVKDQIDPQFLGMTFDPKNQYSLPYGWGTTGIAYNKELFKGKITGWKDLFENASLKGRFSLLDDVRETLGAALKYKGYSLNSTNADEIAKAKDVLIHVRKGVKAFSSDPYNLLVQGEVVVAHSYSTDGLKASYKTNGKIEYVIPQEGATLWVDSLVIPKGATHIPAAHQLIQFLLQAKVNAARAAQFYSSPVVNGATALLPVALQKDLRLFPHLKPENKMETMTDLGKSNAEWDRAWTEIKSAGD